MPGYDRNSEWETRLAGFRTDCGLVEIALQDPTKAQELLARYRKPVMGYLNWFLIYHKLVADEDAAAGAARVIWNELRRAFPERLANGWGEGKKGFRELLREGVYLAYHSWMKPATRKLISPGAADDQTWRDMIRQALLDRALEKLKAYQRANERKGNRYYVIFRLWDKNRLDTNHVLNARLAAHPNGRRLDAENFKQSLGRARNKFGEYLFEEVATWLAQHEPSKLEQYLSTFEELDLMDDYAMKSKTCRWLLGLEDEEEVD